MVIIDSVVIPSLIQSIQSVDVKDRIELWAGLTGEMLIMSLANESLLEYKYNTEWQTNGWRRDLELVRTRFNRSSIAEIQEQLALLPFYFNINSDEASEIIAPMPSGTFLIRASSIEGTIARNFSFFRINSNRISSFLLQR
jgi:hypothetical protein